MKKKLRQHEIPHYIHIGGLPPQQFFLSKPLKENKKQAIERIAKEYGIPMRIIRRNFLVGKGNKPDTFKISFIKLLQQNLYLPLT